MITYMYPDGLFTISKHVIFVFSKVTRACQPMIVHVIMKEFHLNKALT